MVKEAERPPVMGSGSFQRRVDSRARTHRAGKGPLPWREEAAPSSRVVAVVGRGRELRVGEDLGSRVSADGAASF